MSKYIQDLTDQLKGKNIAHFTKELQASTNLAKIVSDQNNKKRQAKIRADIQKLLER